MTAFEVYCCIHTFNRENKHRPFYLMMKCCYGQMEFLEIQVQNTVFYPTYIIYRCPFKK